MIRSLEQLLDRVRSWSPSMQAEAERVLLALEEHGRFELGIGQNDVAEVERHLAQLGSGVLNEDGMMARLKRAYYEGVASGPGEEVDVEGLIASFKERTARRG